MADPAAEPELTSRASEWHSFRPGSLLLGLLALAISVLVLLDEQQVVSVDGVVAAAVLLVLAGATNVIRAVVRLLRR